MSTTALATAGSFDDFTAWQAELNETELEPLAGPTAPKQRSRSTEKQTAIDESLGIYRHRTHERRN